TAGLIGVVLGSIAGFAGGWIDNFLSRIVDILYSLPYMLIVIMIMSSLPQGSDSTIVLFFAIALISWLTMFRVVRGQIMSLKNSEFVEAAKSMGARSGRIIFRHLLPNTIGIIIVYSSLQFPSFIMSESFLSFLGLGVSAPKASWGTLVSEGVQGMQLYPWRLFVPGLAMTIFLFAVNFIGDGLRDALDPQGKNRN
ncbi:MAG TPA: ABC transporter permease, partial [Spirochaetales bacterium]|nr:ABC transporter permease [Spirochaetales bacterium]